MPKHKIRVGFDLDGVILYNPIRTFRPIASFFKFLKPFLFHERSDTFYFPNTALERFIWRLLHKTSYKVADGFDDISRLAKQGAFDAYLITSRYDFLKKDFEYWVKKLNVPTIFKGWYYNKMNLQPNVFKRSIIKKLRFDYYVEDNWGVIQKLLPKRQSLSGRNGVKILWLSNFLDKNIPYRYKFFSLKEVAKFISSHLS